MDSCSRTRRRSLQRIAALTAVALLPRLSQADDDDHERARQAVLAGEILPLSEVILRHERASGARVLRSELEREHGSWIYELTLLYPDGRLARLDVDAGTGDPLGRQDKRGRKRRRGHDDER
ncbi:MAG: peptidase [Burkholderiaceae bacterium]